MDTGTLGQLREHIAAELRAILARRRISAAELARQLGWAQSYMARRLDGRVALDADDIEAIATTLKVDIVDLMPPRGARINDGSTRPAGWGMRTRLHERPQTSLASPAPPTPATSRRPAPVADPATMLVA